MGEEKTRYFLDKRPNSKTKDQVVSINVTKYDEDKSNGAEWTKLFQECDKDGKPLTASAPQASISNSSSSSESSDKK